MANLVGKLGQTIQGSVANFGAGFKQAAISGNPALFGAGLAALEKAFEKNASEEKAERQKDREERRRDRQFNEENQNEQRKLDHDILKSLRAIEKMLEDFVSKNKKSFFDKLKEMFEPLLLLFSNLMFGLSRLLPLLPVLVAGLISLSDGLSDFVKLFAGWTKQLGGAFANLIKKLGTLFDDVFKTDLFSKLGAKLSNLFDGLFKNFKGANILEKLTKGLGSWIDDLFKAARGRIAGVAFVFLEKFGTFFDDAVKAIKGVFTGSFFTKLAKVFDVELDFIKNFKLPEGFSKVKELFNSGMSSLLSFFDDIANNPIFSKIATFLGKFAKSIPIIGNIIMIIEGFFAAFDTESIASALGKQMGQVSIKDRVVALLGGIVGSIFGIFDLIGSVINAVFGLEEKEGEESVQKKATRIATQFIDNILKWLEGLGRFIIGLLTFDKKAMGAAMGDMSQAVIDSLGVLLSMIANVFIDGINFLIRAIPFISNDNQIKKLSTFTKRETEIATAKKNVSARPRDAAGGKAWDEQYGGMYNKDGTLKKEFAKQQEDLLKRATADGFYEALHRPGSLSESEASNIIANITQEEFDWQQKQAQKAQQYQQERDALQDRFYNTLEQSYKTIIDKVIAKEGGFGSSQPGGARTAIEQAIAPAFEKLGTKIFGKDSGKEMGQIFTQLFGNYADQVLTQIVGPALFGGTEAGSKQANRFFNSLASGNKKNATEDFLKGMFGINTGVRSAIGYEEGAAELARDLAIVTGGPFDSLFGMDPTGGKFQDETSKQLKTAVSDPIVEAQYEAADRIVKGLTKEEAGKGTVVKDAAGNIISTGPPDKGAAMSRILDKGFNLLTMKAGQKVSKAVGVTDSPLLSGIVQGMVQDFGAVARAGGSYDLVGSLGRTLGLDLPPNAGVQDIIQGISNATSKMPAELGEAVTKAAGKMGASPELAGQMGQAVAVAGQAYMNITMKKALSGEFEVSKGMSTFQDVGIAVATAIGGPIAGTLVAIGSAIFNRAFGRGKKRVTGQGITGTVGEDASAIQNYADWHQKGGWFSSSRSGTDYSAADPKLVEGITQAAKSLTTAIRESARNMGLGRIPLTPSATTTATFERMSGSEAIIFSSLVTKTVDQTTSRLFGTDDQSRGGMFGKMLDRLFGPRTITEKMGLKNLSVADQNLMKSLKAGSIARLSDGTIIQVGDDATYAKETSGPFRKKNVLSGATLSVISDPNIAYRMAFEKMQQSFSMAIGKLNLSGKNEREQEEAIEEMLKSYGEAFVRNAFGNLLDGYQKAGERLYETFDRLVSASINFNERMKMLGFTFGELRNSVTLDIMGLAAMSDQFIELYGGMDKFMTSTQQYFDAFYTQEEKLQYQEDVGRRKMADALADAGLEVTVDDMISQMGDTFEDARLAYRAIVDQFVEDNAALLAANDPEAVRRLAALQGDLAASYYTTVTALQELERIRGTSKEELQGAARAIFMADMAAMGRSFATGGVSVGPKSGYAAVLHGTEAVVPLPNGREIPVELQFPQSELGMNRTYINNIIGNGNATVRSQPTNVITSPPQATSGSSPNRVLSSAY